MIIWKNWKNSEVTAMDITGEALRICPQAVMFGVLSCFLFFIVPVYTSVTKNERIRRFFLILTPCPAILWILTPMLSFHQAFGNSVFMLIAALLWYLVGLRWSRAPQKAFWRILWRLVITGPVLLGSWVLWGFSSEILVGSYHWIVTCITGHRLENNPDAKGTINLYTERYPCDLCIGVIEQFKINSE